ncbi:MAG: hypothetical protein SFU83_14200 [Meiothermus sp.]|nr:hypothetical protein [Meiothermus sp.]
MYEFVLILHNVLRWLVVGAAVWVMVASVRGLQTGQYAASDRTAGRVFVGAMDTMLLLGLILMFVSPVVRAALADLGGAMGQRDLRFFAMEHWLLMVFAVALAHLGSSRVRRAVEASAKHRQALIFYGLSLLLVLFAIPWWRPLLRM